MNSKFDQGFHSSSLHPHMTASSSHFPDHKEFNGTNSIYPHMMVKQIVHLGCVDANSFLRCIESALQIKICLPRSILLVKLNSGFTILRRKIDQLAVSSRTICVCDLDRLEHSLTRSLRTKT